MNIRCVLFQAAATELKKNGTVPFQLELKPYS